MYIVFSKFVTPNLIIYQTFLWHSTLMFFTFTFLPVIWNSYSKFCLIVFEVGFNSIVRYDHGAMGRWINPSWWTHWAISHFSLCSTTGETNVVCTILSVWMVHIKEPSLLIGKNSVYSGNCRFSLAIWVVLYQMSDTI